MSHLYNPYPTDQRSSATAGYGHSSAQAQSDPQRTSHSNPGSSYRSALPELSPNIPSLVLPLPAFMDAQSRPAKEEELKRSADLHSDRAREESLHLPRSYAMTQPFQGHRKAVAECSDRSLNWLPTYKSTNEDNASKYYTPAASSIFPDGGESRTSAASSIFSGGCESRFMTISERKPHEQSISGLGEYEFPVRETANAQPKLSQGKYTSESARNIILHFGLEKEDLEKLISYPEDQLTPQTLPFILRQIRQQKTKNPVSVVQTVPYPEPKTTTSVSDTDFRGHMREVSHQDYRPRGILKTSKVIDYGHVSQLSAGPGEEVGMARPKTNTDSRILPGVSKSLSLKVPEPSQLKLSQPHLSDTPSPSVASGRLGVMLYDSLKDPRQPLKQVSKVPEPKQQQQPPVKQEVKKQQPATQRSPTPQVNTSSSVPAPDHMYDYAAITPGMYPHSCSLCDKECFSVKEWINHQNTELHLENCKLLRTRFPEWDGQLLTSLSASDVYARSSTARPLQSLKKSHNSSSCSHSRSYSPQRYRGSGSRRDQERSRYRSRSRSYSPRQSSRRTRRSRTRSRSQSPLYRSTTSRYRSRSRSYERRSSPRRRDDRLSSAKRTWSRERRSSEKSSAEKLSKEAAADGKQKTGLTMGEMMEENLLLKRITCVEMKRVFSPGFASNNRRVLQITNLPKYEEGSYTERDVANLLTPFGFQHEDEHLHNIYIIPQKRMAFAVLTTAEMAISVIRASVKDCFKLFGCKLFVKILKDKISCPMEFYQSLMVWMKKKITLDQAERIVFIKNISPSEARNLRDVFKTIGNVMNYVPLLNKVFIEFYWMHEADRLGVWYSLLRQPPQHFIYRLGTPRNKVTALRPDEPKRALPDLSLRVTDANVPTIPFIPLGCSPPFYVTMTTFPFIFPTICPWFNIPSFQDPSALKLPSHYSTIMMTGLPEDGYCQLHVARMVWSLFHQRNIHSLFYRVMVLPLQRRAFIYFNTHESCREFSQRHMTKPFCIKNKPVNIHFVNDNTNPGFTEETMYRQLMKLSNAHVPTLSGLDQRLLLVQVSEVSLELIQAVMKEVVSVGRLAGFLPLGNRICIEMLEPSDRMKVMEAKLGSLTAPHIWKKVIRVDTVQSLHQHQLQSLDITINLKQHLHWAAPDQTTQDSNTSSSSSTKPAAANMAPDSGSAPVTSKDVEMVEQGSSGESEKSSSTKCKSQPDKEESKGTKSKERSSNTECSSEQEKSTNNSLATLSAVGLMGSAENTAAEPADKGSTSSEKKAEQKDKDAAMKGEEPPDKAEKPAESSIKLEVLVKQDPQEEEEEDKKLSKEAADGKQKTGLTMGEMMEESLLLKRITCVEMKRVFSPEFTSENRLVLQITNLPKYEEGSYTERDVANLLTPFGFQHEDEHLHNIYVIPQKCMALAVLPTAKMAVKIIRASVKDCFKLSGCKLIVKILEDRISTPLVFYRVLMKWMNEKMKSHYAKNIVFVKKISPSEARNLREVLKKIGNVMNYVPLLNKVFIHFFRIHEVDRFGIWYSLLRQPPQHSIYRLVTPWGKKTVSRLKGWARALPDLSLRVTDANLPTISSIPLGCGPPFYVTMTTFPFIFPTICPWFNIPSFQDPSAVKLPSHYSTIMMTGLPEDGYCQLHVARMVWSLFHQRNIHSLFYRVMVLPLQRRAFIYFNTHESCREFSQRHMTKPFCIKNKPVNIHFVNDNTNPGLTEETMYRQLLKLSNAHVPMLSGLDQRLLLVQVSEVSLKLIMAVMKEVVSVGRLAGFLPLGNRICIEMLEPSDRMKVMEAKLGSLTAPHIWKKVIRVDTVQSLHQHQLQSLDVTIDLEEDLHWAAPDQTAQDSNKNQSLDGLSFQVLDSIDDEGTADREESGEPQAETSFQALDSVTEDQSATDHVTEVAVAENVSNETKVSTFAKRPRRGRGGKRERKPKVLAANKDITGQENFKVIDLVENPIETEDPEPTSQDVTPEAELEPIKEEEVYQVIDSVAEQSAPNAMKKQGHRGRPTRRSARGRTSEGESEEKQDETRTISEVTKPDSITNKEGVNKVPCTVLDSAGSETIQKTEKVWRRRSTRGNKEEKIISQTASSKEEPKYQVIDSVEDDVAPEEAVMVTKATRGRRGRPAKRDIPTRGHTAAKECEEGKEMSPKALAEASGQSDKATASLEEGQCEDKVVGNHRKELMGPEAKRSRSQSPDVPADVTLLTYNPSNPLGQEFVVPKAGFFCNICSIFYMNENTAKEVHCSSRRHFDNLKKYYLKLKTTPSRASSSTSSNVSSDRM
ncbi:uncharacterized protein LOC114480106 isoform X3 [Gouania willdenowi]|uniref:uncharacterized protein LOC114480106 isoform X3 n=1 Tax=Gouania willdenowi TaxID=441366 RepID=UPI001054F354|nr:uncharacterized protein LOC114480106 isoform X3 [Gouania willdenowi]